MRTGPDEKLLGEVTISGLSCPPGGAPPTLMATITVRVQTGGMLEWVKVFVGGNEATAPNETSVTSDSEGTIHVYSWQHGVESPTQYEVEAKAKITLAVESSSGKYPVTCSL